MHAGPVHTFERLSPREIRRFRGSFALLLLAEAMIFVTVFSVRFVFAGRTVPADLDWTWALGVTVALILSAFPAWRAERLVRSDRPKRAHGWLLAALGLGAVALALIAVDWATLSVSPQGRFGGPYLLATVYHALHIVAGLVALLALAGSSRRGRFSAANPWSLEAGVWFWTFVIGSWLALFAVFFLL